MITKEKSLNVLVLLNTVTSRQKQFQWDMNRKDVASLPQPDRERISFINVNRKKRMISPDHLNYFL
jgi:hypothetical protein